MLTLYTVLVSPAPGHLYIAFEPLIIGAMLRIPYLKNSKWPMYEESTFALTYSLTLLQTNDRLSRVDVARQDGRHAG